MDIKVMLDISDKLNAAIDKFCGAIKDINVERLMKDDTFMERAVVTAADKVFEAAKKMQDAPVIAVPAEPAKVEVVVNPVVEQAVAEDPVPAAEPVKEEPKTAHGIDDIKKLSAKKRVSDGWSPKGVFEKFGIRNIRELDPVKYDEFYEAILND